MTRVTRRFLTLSLAFSLVLLGCRGGQAPPGQADAGIGEAAVDGQFTFFVDSFECGLTEVISGVFRSQANGQFCLLRMHVSNSGSEGRRFMAGAQTLVNQEGGQLNHSPDASLIVSPGAVNEELNPGLSLQTTVVFDVSDPDEIVFARLRDAPLSQGVLIDLSG